MEVMWWEVPVRHRLQMYHKHNRMTKQFILISSTVHIDPAY